MKSIKVNLKDKKILSLLDVNSRQANTKIAKQIGLSKDVVNYRIKKLEQIGIIKGYYTLIDFYRLGYMSIRVYLKLIDATPKKEKEIINYLTKHQKIFFLGEIDGPYDIVFGTWIKDIYAFEEFYLDFKKEYKQYLGKENIAIFTKVHHFHRAYILNKKTDDSKSDVFGPAAKEPHDQTDINILKLLAGNSRIPTIEIAHKLNIPPRTVAFRIKQLEKKKIIRGYRFIFDFNQFGYEYYKVDLILKDISRMKELTNYAKTHPNIVYIDGTISGSDFEFDLEVKNKEQFTQIIKELKTKFPEIRTWSYLTLKQYKKLLYFPET